MTAPAFGNHLRTVRDALSLTRPDLARAITERGVSCTVSTIEKWESGYSTPRRAVRPLLWASLRKAGAGDAVIKRLGELLAGVA